MKNRKKQTAREVSFIQAPLTIAIASALSLLMAPAAQALELDTGNPDVKVRWDNSVKYTAAFRVKKRDERYLDDAQQSEGNANFSRGLISNRVDLLSELDVTYQSFGARVSGAAWYDSVYNRSNDYNRNPGLWNPASVPPGEFTDATRKLHGRKAEILDAFVFGQTNIGDSTITGRLGQHTVLYGESLFFPGISGGMGPIDAIKALSVPNTQAKEIFRPVKQVSGQWQFRPNMTVGGYYQFEWEKTRIPAVGSYFSPADHLDAGGERVLLGPTAYLARVDDQKPKDSGQGGVQFRWTPENSGVDLGFYAIRYHEKTPQLYFTFNAPPVGNFAGPIGTYTLPYQENVKAFGASASTTIGSSNIAGEISYRRNASLATQPQTALAFLGQPSFNNRDNIAYAVGNTVQAQVSTITNLPRSFIANEANLLGEIVANRVTSVTRNENKVDPNSNIGATNWGLRAVYEPTYRAVLPATDISVPVGLGYSRGRSPAGAFGPNKGGDISIGLNAVYQSFWNFGVSYTHYYGAMDVSAVLNPNYNPDPAASGTPRNDPTMYTYKQIYKDRNFIAFSARATF